MNENKKCCNACVHAETKFYKYVRQLRCTKNGKTKNGNFRVVCGGWYCKKYERRKDYVE